MKFIIVAILFAFGETATIGVIRDCVKIRNKNYEKETLLRVVEMPYQLAIDRDTDTLFFSFTAETDEAYKSAYYVLKTGRYGIVGGISGSFAHAVGGNTVYMGGEDGIYTYDYSTKTAIKTHIKDDVGVYQMFYKDGLYFTTYPEEKAYYYKDSQTVEVPALKNISVSLLAVTNDHNLLYFNSSGVYLYNITDHKHYFLDDVVASGVAPDINGNLYISSSSGIHYFNDKLNEIEHLSKLDDNVYGIAIDSDGNIIYSKERSVNRLIPAKGACTETEKKEVEIDVGK